MERAIEFLLKNQANYDARSEKTDQRIEQMSRRIEEVADNLTEFTRVMMGHVEAQNAANKSFRQTMRELAKTQQQDRQQTQQDISYLAQAQLKTQQEISDLTKVVNNLTKFSSGNGGAPQE
ncbi:MAG: hypothetical protein H7Y30_01705 [Pyrinomonadaceae bacterium]|nr:hypothetical protein [Pyrinomonadaceae bacterium]